MIEYLPWSKKELRKSLDLYEKGEFSIIDIELGGHCNLSCIYCDSPDRTISSNLNVGDVENVLGDHNLEWLFICGLGEPTYSKNRKILFSLLKLCESFNLKCCIFTNSLNIDSELCDYLESGILHLLIKLDSLNPSTIEKIYGTKRSGTIISNITRIEEYIRIEDNCSNIAVSIVPTRINQNEILELVKYCLDKGMFPLIGYLEYAGSAIQSYDELTIPQNDLWRIKEEICRVTNEQYSIPICPAVVGGIHVSYDSKVIVDRSTGLSCSWFWLKTPKTIEICSFDSSVTWSQTSGKIVEYRNKKLEDVSRRLDALDNLPFGGCGGDIKFLLSEYLNIQNKIYCS